MRLRPSKDLNSYTRKVLHVWAEKHNIDCKTYCPTEKKEPKDKDKVMLFCAKITASEWNQFDEWISNIGTLGDPTRCL